MKADKKAAGKQALEKAQHRFNYPPHIELSSIDGWTCTDYWVENDSGYMVGCNKMQRQKHDFQIVDPRRYQISTKLNFSNVVDGPEVLRSMFFVCFGPITADILDGTFVFMCACDMERVPRDKWASDEECARMSLGVFKTNCQNAEMARAFDGFECDSSRQKGKNCRFVYHCSDCDEVYCQQCAREIPQKPRQRYERIKLQAELQENPNNFFYKVKDSDLETLEEKLKKNPRLTNVTFDSCIRDGCAPGSFPFETDKYCKPVDDSY